MSREDQILELVREGLLQFADELQGYSIILFGSRVRGDAR